MSGLRTFYVFHPLIGGVNHDCEIEQPFIMVATVRAKDLSHAFYKAQNFQDDYAMMGVRSTCIGDLLMDNSDEVHMVMGRGFKELTGVLEL
jgi:hypothetical protein